MPPLVGAFQLPRQLDLAQIVILANHGLDDFHTGELWRYTRIGSHVPPMS
jgi:hypothetical protein